MTPTVTDLIEDATLRISPDGDMRLLCGRCDADLCEVEHDDTLGTLGRVVEDHLCVPAVTCPGCGHGHNPICGPAACDCCASIASADERGL